MRRLPFSSRLPGIDTSAAKRSQSFGKSTASRGLSFSSALKFAQPLIIRAIGKARIDSHTARASRAAKFFVSFILLDLRFKLLRAGADARDAIVCFRFHFGFGERIPLLAVKLCLAFGRVPFRGPRRAFFAVPVHVAGNLSDADRNHDHARGATKKETDRACSDGIGRTDAWDRS